MMRYACTFVNKDTGEHHTLLVVLTPTEVEDVMREAKRRGLNGFAPLSEAYAVRAASTLLGATCDKNGHWSDPPGYRLLSNEVLLLH